LPSSRAQREISLWRGRSLPRWARNLSIVVLVFVFDVASLIPLPASAQAPGTGTPPFSSFSGGSGDLINLGDLNVHLTVPIIHKPGRGLPFDFDLAYDSTVWTPKFQGQVFQWQPVQNLGSWGWTVASSEAGYFTHNTSQQGVCQPPGWSHPLAYAITEDSWVYWDGSNTPHAFNGYHKYWQSNPPGGADQCGNSWFASISTINNEAAPDVSGYSLTVGDNYTYPGCCPPPPPTFQDVVNLYSRDGTLINVPINPSTPTATGSLRDRNGNIISFNNGSFTDTLGTNVLTISGTPPSPPCNSSVTYTYTPPSGTGVAISVTYRQYNVRTNFQISGTSEYPGTPTEIPTCLVDRITYPDNSFYSFLYEATPSYPNDVTARISSVTLPTGGTISYVYYNSSNNFPSCTTGSYGIFSDGTASCLRRTTPDGTWTYTRTPGTNAAYATLVTAPKMPYDPAANQTIVQFQGIYETQRDIYQGSAPSFTSVPISENILQTANLKQETQTCYNNAAAPCTATALSLPITQRTVVEQYGAGGKQCEHNYFYNSVGSLIEQDDYDYGLGAPGALLKKLLITYASNLGNIADFPKTVTICNGTSSSASCQGASGSSTGTVVAQTTFKPDETTPTSTSGVAQHTAVSGSRGNLTSVNYPTSTLTSHFTYYDTGSPYTSQDVNGATTTYNYSSASCQMAFPTSISEPLSLSSSMTWNCTGGEPASVTDENNQTTTNKWYDHYFWRLGGVVDPLGNTLWSYYQPNPSYSTPFEVERYITFNNGNSIVSDLQYMDGLGRTYVDQSLQSPNSSTLDSVSYTFDPSGRPYSVSMPCATGYIGTCSTPKTTTTYDALNRPLTITDGGNGTVNYTYNQNDAFVTIGPAPSGENPKRRQLEYDALGRLTSVCEITSGAGSGTCRQTVSQTGYWTNYSYDALGNLKVVTQNAQASSGSQQTRSYTYDAMSRLTSETNPESGTTTYVYDSNGTCGTFSGDLVRRVDANGNVTCYHYDQLHRVTSITYPSGPNAAATSPKTFFYDTTSFSCPTGANVKARLAEAYTGPSTAKITDLAYCYSPRGELTDIYTGTQSFSGYNHITKTYWADGQLQSLSGPPGLPTIYYGASDGSGLDGEGRITKVIAASGPNPINCSTPPCVSYNSAGQVTNLIFGSGDSDSYGYDPNTGRMKQYQFTVNGQSAVGNLTWNANWTLASLNVTDPFNSLATQNCTYADDDLARLANVNCPNVWSQTFTYDPFGNITKNGSYWWPPSGSGYNSATNRYNTLAGTSYDNNGNLLNDTFHTYQWDAEGTIIAVDVGGSNYTDYLTYDAWGNIAEYKQTYANGNPPWLAQLVYGVQGRAHQDLGKTIASGGGTTFTLPLVGGASMAGWSSSSTTVYGHSDWQGSIRMNSTPSRTVLSII